MNKFEKVECKEGRSEAEIESEKKRRESEAPMNTFVNKTIDPFSRLFKKSRSHFFGATRTRYKYK